MEIGLLVASSFMANTRALTLLSIVMLLCHSGLVNAKDKDDKDQKPFLNKPVSPKQNVRFYKANRQLQADRIKLVGGDTSQAGCQNTLKKTRVFKVLQIGFSFCTLYEEKDCAIGSLVPVQSEKQQFSTYFLSEGAGWFPQGEDERGVKVGSWNCANEVETGEMRVEHELAATEIIRLRKAKNAAKRHLEEAQAKYADSEKSLGAIRDYAERARKEAVSIGAIEPPKETIEANSEEKLQDK